VKNLDLNTTIDEWVSQRPQASRVFDALQLDYCSGGRDALQQACWDRQLVPQDVLAQLYEVVKADDIMHSKRVQNDGRSSDGLRH